MSDPSTAMVRAEPAAPAPAAYEPRNLEEARALAQSLVKSGLLGKAVPTPEAALAIMIAGRELGLPTMQALRGVYVVEGKPSLSADLMVALVRRSGLADYLRIVESTPERCVYETRRRGDPAPVRVEWTMDMARRAGLAKRQPWEAYPATMLRHRAAAELCRAVYPDLLLGVYSDDEAEDIRRSRTVSATVMDVQPLPPPEPRVVPEPDERPLAAVLEERLRAAQTLDDLAAVARSIAGDNGSIDPAVKAELRRLYTERRDALAQPAEEG